MRFYLNGKEVKVAVSPVLTETQDKSLDTLSLTLEVNDEKAPVKPRSTFRIDYDNGEYALFRVLTDIVEVFSKKPIKYIHTLTLAQNTADFKKYIIRNSQFSQPANKKRTGKWVGGYTDDTGVWRNNVPCFSSQIQKIITSPREKTTTDFYVEFKLSVGFSKKNQTFIEMEDDFNTINELNALHSGNTFTQNQIYLFYTLGSTEQKETISIPFNERVKVDRIKELIEEGATNIYIATDIPTGLYNSRYTPIFPTINVDEDDYFFTNAVWSLNIEYETHYFTAYDLIDMIIKREGFEDLLSLPTSGDFYNLLNNTIPPNFTFTQCSLFDALQEIFDLWDATMTLDEDNILGIEYLNDHKPSNIKLTDFSNIHISLGEEKFTNSIITYYQNALIEEKFPNNGGFIGLRTNEVGVPTNEESYRIILPHNIEKIDKVEILIDSLELDSEATQPYPHQAVIKNVALDITDRIIERSIWSNLPTSKDMDNYAYLQINTGFYTKGSNSIEVNYIYKDRTSLTYNSLNNIIKSGLYTAGYQVNEFSPDIDLSKYTDFKFRITYTTKIDGRTQVESIVNKAKGQIIANQADGNIDLNKMGLNMLGLSMKLGEPTLKTTHKIKRFSDRIKKGQIFRIDDENWIANICSYTIFDNENIIGNIEFVKNYNALSQKTKILDDKRLSNISNELTLKSEINKVEYVYFSSQEESIENESLDLSYITESIINTFEYGIPSLYDTAYIGSGIYVPMIKYGAGNCICFEMSYTSPISAGNQLTYSTTEWFQSTKYFSKVIKYTDDEGFLDDVSIFLATSKDKKSYDNFPTLDEDDFTPRGLIEVPYLLKQPNEIFAFNYELCFLPVNKDVDFIGSAFINNNNFIGNVKKTFYLYYTTTNNDFQYSILDTKGEGSRKKIDSVTYIPDGVQFGFVETQNIKTWSICDEDGNIYFASNNANNGTSTTKVMYFITRKTRI